MRSSRGGGIKVISLVYMYANAFFKLVTQHFKSQTNFILFSVFTKIFFFQSVERETKNTKRNRNYQIYWHVNFKNKL